MTNGNRRYIFRFIHVRGAGGWSVQDTLNGRIFGHYACEDEAVRAALCETRRQSEFRHENHAGGDIPLI